MIFNYLDITCCNNDRILWISIWLYTQALCDPFINRSAKMQWMDIVILYNIHWVMNLGIYVDNVFKNIWFLCIIIIWFISFNSFMILALFVIIPSHIFAVSLFLSQHLVLLRYEYQFNHSQKMQMMMRRYIYMLYMLEAVFHQYAVVEIVRYMISLKSILISIPSELLISDTVNSYPLILDNGSSNNSYLGITISGAQLWTLSSARF